MSVLRLSLVHLSRSEGPLSQVLIRLDALDDFS